MVISFLFSAKKDGFSLKSYWFHTRQGLTCLLLWRLFWITQYIRKMAPKGGQRDYTRKDFSPSCLTSAECQRLRTTARMESGRKGNHWGPSQVALLLLTLPLNKIALFCGDTTVLQRPIQKEPEDCPIRERWADFPLRAPPCIILPLLNTRSRPYRDSFLYISSFPVGWKSFSLFSTNRAETK